MTACKPPTGGFLTGRMFSFCPDVSSSSITVIDEEGDGTEVSLWEETGGATFGDLGISGRRAIMDLDGGPPLRFARETGAGKSHCTLTDVTDFTGNTGGSGADGSLKR